VFYPIANGSVFEITDNAFGFVYNCQLPPYGYGKNIMTGEVEKTDVLINSNNEQQQCFERITLPYDYKEKRKKEQQRQQIDSTYIDYYLEDFRIKEWHRRLCGVWFMRYNPFLKKSEPIYLTGQHWLYCNWWIYQGKFMNYREPDRETFYVAAYCQEDPKCLGLNELTQRKSGKTGRSGCIAYERTSRYANHHCGIQSKTDIDGFTMFKKAIVAPWRKLPHFYRPVYDLMKGDDPNELRFFATSRRGQQAEFEEPEEALESFIDFGTSEEGFYDGPELHTYVSDETGKTRKEISVKERARVTREATEIEGEIRGFHHSTTTVEVDKGEVENIEFQELTAQSNPLSRDENGMTTSGYYTFFQPCTKYMYFDKHGFPDEQKALQYVLNRRKKYEEEGDLRGLSSYKRKKPITFKEAFSVDGEYALYNPELLNNQLDSIQWTNKFTEFGNLEWENGDRLFTEKNINGEIKITPSKLKWVESPTGKFEKLAGWIPKNPNNIYYRGGNFYPNNNLSIRIGCDPFKYDKTKDKRRSNCAAFAYQIPDNVYPDLVYDDCFVLRYAFREESTRLANEDILKMAWWCGCEVLFERNVNHWKNDFIDMNCGDFLTWLPNEVEPGIITSTGSNGVQTICNYTEAYINEFVEKVYFKSLLNKQTGWLGFKVEDTEKFDEPMAAGITLIAVRGAKRQITPKQVDIKDYFPKTSGWTY